MGGARALLIPAHGCWDFSTLPPTQLFALLAVAVRILTLFFGEILVFQMEITRVLSCLCG